MITITWEYYDYDYIHSECNRLQLFCKVIMITMYITQTLIWVFINIHPVTCKIRYKHATVFTCCFVKNRHAFWYVLEMKIYKRLWCHCTTLICFNISEINIHNRASNTLAMNVQVFIEGGGLHIVLFMFTNTCHTII